jgi:hypothetical protein
MPWNKIATENKITIIIVIIIGLLLICVSNLICFGIL